MIGAYIEGIGMLGPGLSGWAAAHAVLCGQQPYQPQKTILPPPQLLPPAERRRSCTVVKVALAIGTEALAAAQVEARDLPTVFASSGGEGENCHTLCEVLASSERAVSPTRFHNSVHNVAAGYWGIATGARTSASVVCAHDGSFSAGLLEALTLTVTSQSRTLLVAYDTGYPEPLGSARPIRDTLGIALVLAPQASAHSMAQFNAAFTADPVTRLEAALLESLRTAIPAARGLPLLQALALRRQGQVVLDYLHDLNLTLAVNPC